MRINKIKYLNILIALITGSFISCSWQPDFDASQQKISEIVEKNADSVDVVRFFPDEDVRDPLHKEFNEFYKARDYNLAWLTFDEPKEIADDLLMAIDNADKEGLSPNHYNLPQIEKLLSELYNIESRKKRRKQWRKKLIKSKKFKERFYEQDSVLFNKIVNLDLFMTASYLTYSSHLLSGKIDPNEKAEWYSEPRKMDLSSYLNQAVIEENIIESLQELNPPHEQYDHLKAQLVKYKDIKKTGGWEKYQINRTFSAGDTGRDVTLLRQRLRSEGFIIEDSLSEEYDNDLKEVVQTYQLLRGIQVNGVVNEETREELNKPIDEIIRKITFNMERMRWIHGPFGDHYVLVNIPAFRMTVMKNDDVQLKMKAIVGETVNKTPVFSDSLEYIVFSPEWNVPRSIAVTEMLPQIRKDPDYLRSRNYRLYENWDRDAEEISQNSVDWDEVTPENFNYRIVENPGPNNSLGLVKFMFPNNKAIYLHDTPADHLFNQNVRNFSHGCIRLEKPEDFALYLLADKGWTREDIQSYMNKIEPSTVLLGEHIPVYIVYWTAWVDEKSGLLNLRKDVYNYDKRQMDQLDKKDTKMLTDSLS